MVEMVVELTPSVVGKRRRVKTRIQNLEYRIQKAGNAQSRAGAVGASIDRRLATFYIEETGGGGPEPSFAQELWRAGVGQGEKWGVERRLEAGFLEKWLCSIIRIYTHLPPFITCFWRVTLMWEME